MNLEGKNLKELFKLVDQIGKKRYHKLTKQDFENYKKYDNWRYINGDYQSGTTQESKKWVRDNSDWTCPICEENYLERGEKTIDHKLPRSQYPWLSLDFKNLWVICDMCNQEKGEMHWYEYELYIFVNHPDFYDAVIMARPKDLLRSLNHKSDF